MSFLIQRAAARSLTLTSVNVAVLRIGRGTNQELRSENPAVALEHAVIEGDAAGYLITDKGSITGTYVNRKPVETSRLSKGDVIEVGDLRLDVQLADPAKPLFLRITVERPNVVLIEDDEEGEASSAAVAAAAPGVKVVKSRKFDYAGAYKLRRPWLTKLTVTALLLIVTLAIIGEVARPERQKYFMPGGVSSAHSRHVRNGRPVADDCAACHHPWRGVAAAKCSDCHKPQASPHAKHAKGGPDCISCHAEHRGATALADIPSSTCVECHTNLEPRMALPRAQLASLKFANGRYSFDDIARISSFGASKHPEYSYPKDANTLRFNHEFHLSPKGVFTAKGKREVLQCTTCHDLSGVADPKPVTFAQHCHNCHRLGFDTRLPNEEVPHGGDNGIVYGYVAAAYSGDRDIIGKPPAEVRRILTTRKRVNVDDRAFFLGTKVFDLRCRYCHEVKPRGDRLAVTPPVIPTIWLTHAPNFRHDRHGMIDCEKCHEGVRLSSDTGDVLLPELANCTGCHAENEGGAQTASTCRTCHRYHL